MLDIQGITPIMGNGYRDVPHKESGVLSDRFQVVSSTSQKGTEILTLNLKF